MDDSERVALALAALAEVTDPANVGDLVGASVPAQGVVDLRFATTQPGYPGWAWTVSTSAVDGVEPTVLEVELLPADDALLAPPWVPWAERLAEWRRVHPAGAAEEESEGVEDLDDEDLDDEDDEDLEVDLDDDLDGAEVDEDVEPEAVNHDDDLDDGQVDPDDDAEDSAATGRYFSG